jgi:hypothetical protein
MSAALITAAVIARKGIHGDFTCGGLTSTSLEEKRGAHPLNRGEKQRAVLPSLKIYARATGSDGRLKTKPSHSRVKIQAAICLNGWVEINQWLAVRLTPKPLGGPLAPFVAIARPPGPSDICARQRRSDEFFGFQVQQLMRVAS